MCFSLYFILRRNASIVCSVFYLFIVDKTSACCFSLKVMYCARVSGIILLLLFPLLQILKYGAISRLH